MAATVAALSTAPIQLSFPLPKAPQTNIHIHLTVNTTSLLLFLTTVADGQTPPSGPALGSFVYALPNRTNPSETLSTPLYTYESSIEFTTRMAKLLARRTGIPVYVGNSMSFASAGLGGTVEEEMEGFRRVVEVVTKEVARKRELMVNGIGSH